MSVVLSETGWKWVRFAGPQYTQSVQRHDPAIIYANLRLFFRSCLTPSVDVSDSEVSILPDPLNPQIVINITVKVTLRNRKFKYLRMKTLSK